MVPFYHFHWYSKILTNLSNPNTHLTLGPLRITDQKRNQATKSRNFTCPNSFSSRLHKADATPWYKLILLAAYTNSWLYYMLYWQYADTNSWLYYRQG
jgi:hypothetical protein